MSEKSYEVHPVGWVESSLTDRASAPKQGSEGAPEAVVQFRPEMASALTDISVDDTVWLLTWLDRARRDVLRVRPRDDPRADERGVFSTRSPDRPNPIGLHPVRVLGVDGLRIRVADLEALDGTPVLDVKPVLQRNGS